MTVTAIDSSRGSLDTVIIFFISFLASFIQICNRSDPQLNACLRNTFNNLKPYLAKGIPEIGWEDEIHDFEETFIYLFIYL